MLSPDGKWLLVTKTEGGQRSLMLMSIGGQRQINIAQSTTGLDKSIKLELIAKQWQPFDDRHSSLSGFSQDALHQSIIGIKTCFA